MNPAELRGFLVERVARADQRAAALAGHLRPHPNRAAWIAEAEREADALAAALAAYDAVRHGAQP